MIPSQQSKSTLLRLLAAVVLLIFSALPLHAHHLPPGMEDVDEFENEAAFVAGLRHPLLGWDHLMFSLLAGALIITSVSRGVWMMGFVLMGGLVGLRGISFPGADSASLLTAMTALALACKCIRQSATDPCNGVQASVSAGARSTVNAMILSACITVFLQGMDHGAAWPLAAAVPAYLLGIITTTALLMAAGSAAGWFSRRSLTLYYPAPAVR